MNIAQADFARLHGVSKKTVTIWKQQSRLVMVGSLVDVENSDRLLRAARFGRFRDLDYEIEAEPLPQAEDHEFPVPPDTVTAETMAEFLTGLLEGKFGTHAKAEQVKENALAGIRALELQTKAGTLMETEAAERLFFEAARSERDHWMNWPARVGPELAAELDLPADRITAALVRLVHSELADRGEPEADFTTRSG